MATHIEELIIYALYIYIYIYIYILYPRFTLSSLIPDFKSFPTLLECHVLSHGSVEQSETLDIDPNLKSTNQTKNL